MRTFVFLSVKMSSGSDVLLQMYAKAPSPIRDYYGIKISKNHVSIHSLKTRNEKHLSLGHFKHLEHFTWPARLPQKIQQGNLRNLRRHRIPISYWKYFRSTRQRLCYGSGAKRIQLAVFTHKTVFENPEFTRCARYCSSVSNIKDFLSSKYLYSSLLSL